MDETDYTGLAPAVGGLADHMRRGILGWRQEITTIASGSPLYIDEESAGIIEQALANPVRTRFFVEAAESPEWIDWLDHRGRLNTLFADGELSEQDQRLAWWLVSHFAVAHDDALFALIEHHGGRLNPILWQNLSGRMRHSIEESPDAAVMTRWLLFLTSVIPANTDTAVLSWLAESCASVEAMDSLLRVYSEMISQLNLPIPMNQNMVMYNHYMRNMLTQCIKTNLPSVAESVLEMTSMRLSERHSMLMAWQEGNATWDSDDFSRSAIEPHEQDECSPRY